MNYEVSLSLNIVSAGRKISDRIDEIKSAAPYFDYNFKNEILLFSIKLSDKNELKTFLNIVGKKMFKKKYLTLKIDGWRRQKKGEKYVLSFPVSLLDRDSDLIFELISEIKNSVISDLPMLNNEKNYCDITFAETKNSEDFNYFWSAIGEKNTFFPGLLLKTIHKNCQKPNHVPRKFCFSFDIMEVKILVNNKNYGSYNLPLGRFVYASEKKMMKQTLQKYRLLKGYELAESYENKSGKIVENKKVSFFTISDLHLGHFDIIDATARPFITTNTDEMDKILISNWNKTVSEEDVVIYAGDLTYNLDLSKADNYIKQLNGKIIFVNGNHDTVSYESRFQYELKYKDHLFLFIHNPKFSPDNYPGWIVHGHTHNSRMCDCPFINFKKRTINISCELTSYRPINLDELVEIINHGSMGGIDKIYSIDTGSFFYVE
ncbi:MAG: metallophosphoesterase [Methanomicrobium sp.]|nr:metallophosphoesterase [Methanomicrobium sp.]